MDLWIHSASVEKALWGETINKVKISHFEWKQFSLIATFDWPNMMSVGTLPRTFGLDPDKVRGNIEEYVDIL